MKTRTLITALLLASAALAAGGAVAVPPRLGLLAEPGGRRVRFQVTAVEESAAGRKVLSDATVEGPPGTDFNVNLQDGRFRMRARFLTDLVPGGSLKLRARLDTRRLYGQSENGLPLYEEDSQSHTLGIGFDEAVVLLPFGGGGDPRLKIEITPAWGGQPARTTSGETTPPEITISKPSAGGAISIEATKIPHDFTVEAALLEDGREVARGSADCLLEEARELTLLPAANVVEEAGGGPLALNLTVERFELGRPSDRVAVRFDLSRADPRRPGGREAVALNWAGVANLGSELTYDLGDAYTPAPGKKFELRLRVKLGAASKGAEGVE